jgi:hypothetical protein
MKKTALLTAVCLFSATVLFGQAIKLGVLAGPNWSTFIEPQAGNVVTSSAVFGAHAGLFTEFTIGRWSVEPGVFYLAAGGKSYNVYASDSGPSIIETYSLHYIQVPVNIIYNTPGRRFFFGGGPYAGFGLSGNINLNYTGGSFGETPGSPINIKYIFSQANNPDYGLNLVAGIHVDGGTMFTIGYGIGLRHSVSSFDYSTVRNDVISISIGHSIF